MRHSAAGVLPFVTLLVCSLARTQIAATWTRLLSPNGPPGAAQGMAYDPIRDRMVVPASPGGVYELDGSTWRFVSAPTPYVYALGWDAQRQAVIGLDGVVDPLLTAHVVSWDGVQWRVVGSFPAPLNLRTMNEGAWAYDTTRHVGVWHRVATNASDTFEWDGQTWAQRASGGPVLGPTGLIGVESLVFDVARSETLLVNGRGSETWAWNGSYWRQYFGVSGPAGIFPAVACDSDRGRVVLYGGRTLVPGQPQNTTWEWNGSTWTYMQPTGQPPATDQAGMGYDSARRRMVMCLLRPGGSEVWIYEAVPDRQATFTVFGQGCPGPGGSIPSLDSNGTTPLVGQTLTVALHNLPFSPFALPFGVIGFDDQSWNGAPLPVSLSLIGAPGCTAWIAPEASAQLLNAGGTATWQLPIPFRLSFVGSRFFVQGLVLAPGFNQAGMVFSNAGRATIGTL